MIKPALRFWGLAMPTSHPRCRQLKNERKTWKEKTEIQTTHNGTRWRQAFLFCAYWPSLQHRWSNHVPWRDASSDSHFSKTLVLQGMFGPNTCFCNWNFRTPAWVNNIIGLHESCLGQLPWDQFTGRIPFTKGFLSSGYQLGFSALLISLQFFPHTCNNSSKVVKGIPMGLSFGSYC